MGNGACEDSETMVKGNGEVFERQRGELMRRRRRRQSPNKDPRE